jgi:hypothetical protein
MAQEGDVPETAPARRGPQAIDLQLT